MLVFVVRPFSNPKKHDFPLPAPETLQLSLIYRFCPSSLFTTSPIPFNCNTFRSLHITGQFLYHSSLSLFFYAVLFEFIFLFFFHWQWGLRTLLNWRRQRGAWIFVLLLSRDLKQCHSDFARIHVRCSPDFFLTFLFFLVEVD